MIWPGSPGTIALCWQAAGRAGSPCLASLLGCSQALPQHLQALWGVEVELWGGNSPSHAPTLTSGTGAWCSAVRLLPGLSAPPGCLWWSLEQERVGQDPRGAGTSLGQEEL